MSKQKESNPFLMDSILDDDAKDSFKDAISNARVHNYSAPPTMMTLYDYDLTNQLFVEDEKPKKKIVKPTVIKSSINKVPQQNILTQQQSHFQQPFKYPEQPLFYNQQRQQSYYQNYPYVPVFYLSYPQYDYQYQNMYQKQKQYDINQLLPVVIKMCKDRNGSRAIQDYIQASSNDEIDLILSQLMKQPIILMKDQFGNYVFQKIFQVGQNKHKKRILQIIKGKICQLSYNSFGCRVVQRALQYIKNINEQQDIFLAELKGQIVNLVQDQHGNHVIQRCIEYCPTKKIQCIIEQMIQNIQKLAFHAYGCRVIQKFLENSKTEKSNQKTKTILKKLIQMIIPLCKCQHGNYIMQYIVQNGPLDEKNNILVTIKNNFIPLSLDKYASNVVQKAIRFSNDNYRKQLLNTLQQPFQGTEIGLVVLAQGQFANYVIQKFLEYSDRQTQKNIMSLISEKSHNYNAIKESQYGKHVLSQIQRFR